MSGAIQNDAPEPRPAEAIPIEFASINLVPQSLYDERDRIRAAASESMGISFDEAQSFVRPPEMFRSYPHPTWPHPTIIEET